MEPLASLPELRRYTGAAWGDELVAQDRLASASGAVRSYCGWPISYVEEATAVLDSDGGRVLTVPTLLLAEVHTVTDQDGQALTGYQWSQTGVLYRPDRWPAGLRAVSVVFSGGYRSTPPELVALVCGLAGRVNSPVGVSMMTVGAQSVAYTGEAGPGLSTAERLVLDRYRLADEP